MIALIVIGVGILVAFVMWVLVAGTKRAMLAPLGKPTPEQARVVVEKVEADTETKAEEAKNAPLAQKVDRVRALRDLGSVRGDK